MMEPGSLYADRFDEIIQKQVEHGIIIKLILFSSRPSELVTGGVAKRNESIQLQYPQFVIIIIG